MTWEANDEPSWVPISALEHWSYCPRQCGLIHLEQTYEENADTVRGRLNHLRVDAGSPTTEHGVRIQRNVRVWSERRGLHGRLDALEFQRGVPYPVELKSGHHRSWRHEAMQLCAQALCLEDMLGVEIPAGAIAYRGSGTRRELMFDPELRQAVADTTHAIRDMLDADALPDPIFDRRCHRCSLIDACLPAIPRGRLGTRQFLFSVQHLEVVVVYDVCTTTAAGRRRLRQVAEVCLAYGQRVQLSVFECLVTPVQLREFEHRLLQVIDQNTDRLRMYSLRQPSNQYTRVFGTRTDRNLTAALIV